MAEGPQRSNSHILEKEILIGFHAEIRGEERQHSHVYGLNMKFEPVAD